MRYGVMVCVAVIIAAGCNTSEPAGSDGSSRMIASVRGAVQQDYEGTGAFYVGTDSRRGGETIFSLASEGLGTSLNQHFLLQRSGGLPVEGRYALGKLGLSGPGGDEISAQYYRFVGDRFEAYASVSGELQIRQSSGSRIEGDFQFVGSLYCSGAAVGSGPFEGSCTPAELDPEGARIQVSGTFLARPGSHEALPAR